MYINYTKLIDGDTGEVLKENEWIGYDGFNDKGYKYRSRHPHTRIYFDALPDLSEGAFLLLIMLTEVANQENVLVDKKTKKSRFSKRIYYPLTEAELKELIRFPYGKNKWKKYFAELKKKCIKKINYHDKQMWAINPAFISKCNHVPYWLYLEFKEYMDPYLTPRTINKLMNTIEDIYQDDNIVDVEDFDYSV